MHHAGLDLSSLALECDGGHKHDERADVLNAHGEVGAQEQRCPQLFVQRLATRVAKTLGVVPLGPSVSTATKAAAGWQARRNSMSRVAEFHSTPTLSGCSAQEVEMIHLALKSEAEHVVRGVKVSKKCKLISEVELGGAGKSITIGLPWTPDQFVEQAKVLGHPSDDMPKLPLHIAKAIIKIAQLGPSCLKADLKATMARYEREVSKLRAAEAKLHEEFNPEVESIVAQKRVLLFKKMLTDIRYDDMEVVHLIGSGIRITGEAPKTGIWRSQYKGGQVDVRQLWEKAGEIQQKLFTKPSEGWTEADQILWDTTLEEVGVSLKGLMSPAEVSSEVGKQWIGARRFAIVQKDKVRPIDDFSEHLINASFMAVEKLALNSVDVIAAYCKAILNTGFDGLVEVHLDTGGVLRTKLHDEWTLESWRDLAARVSDLKAAYKQLAVSPCDKSRA